MLFLFSITWGSVSVWWLPVGVLAGLLYAWLMYRQPVNLSNKFRYGLLALRALAVFIIALLLLSPLVKSVNYKPEKPLVLIAQDNSQSITISPALSKQDLVSSLSKLQQQLGDDYEVHAFNFDSKLHNGLSGTFAGKQTDISSALKQLNERFVNRNIGAVVLATDGLYNQGTDPQYEARNFKSSIYTIALGDTVPKRDLLIGNISYNKTAFLGNDFIIEVLAEAYQSNGETMRLSVTEDGRQVHSQSIAVTGNSFKKVIPVKLTADKKGLHKFSISVAPVKNELSTENNTELIYIDVLDAKQKVLLVYQAVHPDISVIKTGIESNKNYEVKTTSLTDLSQVKPGDYSLIILYQLSGGSSAVVQKFIGNAKVPIWYTIGAQSNIGDFNSSQKTVKISGSGEMQEVFAQPVNEFSAFTLSDSTRDKLGHLPPLQAPFGNYGSVAASGVLLKQRIGNVSTSYPLLAFGDDNGRRTAVLAGEGLWRWKLAEFNTYGSNHAIDELLSQSVQYLTANANKQQFRIYPAKNVFDESENILINAELYNDALELVNTPDVKIDLKSQTGKHYNYLFTRNGQSYSLDAGALPSGEYSYTAATKLGERAFNATGQLTIKQLNLEARQSTANHKLLQNIAKQSGGTMLQPSDISKLADLIRKNDNIKTVVYEDKNYSDLVDVKWVFLLILVLLSTEWFLRKREGEV
ncbi:hypothetical protein GCM10023149_35700 [Mucilaginibacter gynuensis]|uniref:VWA domain-containing protein n=1 Tax=Mucilaginibacter gynuensis TaxID=1302236 RepID=A0ABP8GVJ9_9SPHI